MRNWDVGLVTDIGKNIPRKRLHGFYEQTISSDISKWDIGVKYGIHVFGATSFIGENLSISTFHT